MKKFLREVIDSNNPLSSKRLVTLIMAGQFILAGFLFMFYCFYVLFHPIKGQVEEHILESFMKILDDDFYIIVTGFGFITAEQAANVLTRKIEAKYGIKPKEDNNG